MLFYIKKKKKNNFRDYDFLKILNLTKKTIDKK